MPKAVICGLFVLLASCSSSNETPAAPDDAGSTDTSTADTATTDTESPPMDSGCGPSTVPLTTVGPDLSTELTVSGDLGSTRGIFDPAIVWPLDAPIGVMSYSSVPSQDAIFTRIATSDDKGATWTFASAVNAPVDVTVATTEAGLCAGSGCVGRIVHEVSALAIDPSDDPSRKYKVYTHSYFLFLGDPPKLRYDWGYIGVQTAPDPKGPWSSQEKLLGWKSSAPSVSTDGVTQSLSDVEELADCIAFTEPSAITTPSTIEIALGCVEKTARIRIVQLRSADHGAHFSYVGTLLSDADASCLASTQLNAAHLFSSGGKTYLLASTAGSVMGGFVGYDACLVFEVEDLATAKVKKMNGGAKVLRRINGSSSRFTGACAYAEGATALGYVASSLALDEPPRVFRIYKTGVAAP
ncbi:MAG: hypothetical protein ACXVEF_34460 [Polyangiales bacterium]